MLGRWIGHDPRVLSFANSFLGAVFGLSSILGVALIYERPATWKAWAWARGN